MEKLFGNIWFIMFITLLHNICYRFKSICASKEPAIKQLLLSMHKKCDFSPLYLISTANTCVAVEAWPLILNFGMQRKLRRACKQDIFGNSSSVL